MTVEIQTRVNYRTWLYTFVVIVDGAVREMKAARHWEVVKRRNQLCESWSEMADVVTANPIPEIPTLRNSPGGTGAG